MPVVEDWTTKPLNVIRNIFESNSTSDYDWSKDVDKYFCDRLQSTTCRQMVQSLNDKPLHDMRSNTLVKFRCMIQDHFEPEFFLESYEVVNKEKNEQTIYSSRYQDMINCPEESEVNMDSPRNKTGSREVYYCVSIPGESSWVKEKYAPKQMNPRTSGISVVGVKRPLDDDDNNMEVENESPSGDGGEGVLKRPKPDDNSARKTACSAPKKNHPLPDEDGPVCILKVYNEDVDIKVNDVLEVYGIISIDPALSATFDTSADRTGMDEEQIEEERAHCPPPSLVPRIHCVACFKLAHNNPLLPHNLSSVEFTEFANTAEKIRREVVDLLKPAVFDDELVAEYLLFHLIARVDKYTGMMPVGKLSLNITNLPENQPQYPTLLSNLVQHLTTKAYHLPMTLENMNAMRMTPTKNYSTNRLDAGLLQLSDATNLIVDETRLQPGQLNDTGVKNLQALTRLLQFQKVEYNFQYHMMPFQHKISVLVMSESKSLLPCDCQVAFQLLSNNQTSVDVNQRFASLMATDDVIIDRFRAYLTVASLRQFSFDENMMKSIEDDFVESRRLHGRETMTSDDLHLHLTLARLSCKLDGVGQLTPELWKEIRVLEDQRKDRLSSAAH